MMSYEEFTQKEAALESAPQAEREAFYAEILEKETAKTDVRMMAYFHAALLQPAPGGGQGASAPTSNAAATRVNVDGRYECMMNQLSHAAGANFTVQ